MEKALNKITSINKSTLKTPHNLFKDSLNWSSQNIAKPFINTGLIEPVDSIIDLVNQISPQLKPRVNDIPEFKIKPGSNLSPAWLAQTVASGLGYALPFGLSTTLAESGLANLATNLKSDSSLAYIVTRPVSAQILGAVTYGAIMTPQNGQSRLGNSISSAVGFGVFGLGNNINGAIFPKVVARSVIGALGGIAMDTTSSLISQGKAPNHQELFQASISGATLNLAFPVISDLANSSVNLTKGFLTDKTTDNTSSNLGLMQNKLFNELKYNETDSEKITKAKVEFQIGSSLIKAINDSGFKAAFVGGSVRDLLLGNMPKDFDIATSANPSELEKIMAKQGIKVLPVGKSFGVTIVNVNGHQLELATLRQDGNYSDGRRPDSIKLIRDFKQDAARRDFTINSMYVDPNSGRLYDFFNGTNDLKNKLIKAVGNPEDRINEDKLRMLRAIRFASKLNDFNLADDLTQAITKHASEIKSVSAERIQSELKQILLSANPVKGLDLMTNLGLMQHIIPELEALRGAKGIQDPIYHPESSAWEHTKMVVNELAKLPKRNFALMMAGVLHDIAKPDTQVIHDNGRITNYGHAELGAKISIDIARRLKLTNDDTRKLSDLVAYHMKMHEVTNMRPSNLTKLLLRSDIQDLIALEHADTLGRAGGPYSSNYDFLNQSLNKLKSNITQSPESDTTLEIKPIINGKTLIDSGLKPGPKFKQILEDSYNAQLDGLFSDVNAAKIWLAHYLSHSLREIADM